MAETAVIVKLIERRRRRAARDWAAELAGLSVGAEEARRIVSQNTDAEIAKFLRCYAKACTEDAEAERSEGDAKAGPSSFSVPNVPVHWPSGKPLTPERLADDLGLSRFTDSPLELAAEIIDYFRSDLEADEERARGATDGR